jgi:hypothetical protein
LPCPSAAIEASNRSHTAPSPATCGLCCWLLGFLLGFNFFMFF